MKVITSWDIQANFWESNEQFKAISPYNKLYTEDKSKGKGQ